MFVVVTLVTGNRLREITQADQGDGIAAFSTPTVVHFGAAFLISAIMSAPWPSLSGACIAAGLAGAAGIFYMARNIVLTTRLQSYRAVPEDWLWFGVLPLLAYAAALAAAVFMPSAHVNAAFLLAGSTVLLIIVGIHNAWDVVTYLAISSAQE